jgi:hypothetical protein
MNADKIKDFLGRVFEECWDRSSFPPEEYAQRQRDFVFHMTDWLGDLQELTNLYKHAEDVEIDKASTKLLSILYHMIPHLKAAGRLLAPAVPDAFADDWPVQPQKRTTKPKNKSRKTKVSA